MPGPKALIGAGFASGAFVGAALAIVFASGPEAAPPPESLTKGDTKAEGATNPASPISASHRSVKPAPTTADTANKSVERHEVTTAATAQHLPSLLRPFTLNEIQLGWREVRQDAMPQDLLEQTSGASIETMLAVPKAHGRLAAETRNEHEKATAAFAGGDGIALLDAIDGSEPQCVEFVASKGFHALFQPRGGGVGLAGPEYKQGGKLEPGTTLSFPAGLFEVNDLSRGNEPFPSDVTVRGVGMNATLLYLDSQDQRSPLQRLRIEDCTVYCSDGITDVRTHPAILSLHRVRVIGFDCGAGSSVAFYMRKGVALLATECRFEAGYGRHPSSGNLARVSGPCLARFDSCTFERINLRLDDPTVLYRSCTMNELLTAAPSGPTYTGCRITTGPQDNRRFDNKRLTRDINELFPQFGGELRPR